MLTLDDILAGRTDDQVAGETPTEQAATDQFDLSSGGRAPNIGDALVGQAMTPPVAPNQQPGVIETSVPGATDRSLAANSQTYVPLKPKDPANKDDAQIVDLFNQYIANGRSIDDLPPTALADVHRAVTGSATLSDDVINSDPELFYQLKFRQGKYTPTLVDELSKPLGPVAVAADFIGNAVNAVKNTVVNGFVGAGQSLAESARDPRTIIPGNIAMLGSGLVGVKNQYQNFVTGAEDIEQDVNYHVARALAKSPQELEKLDRQQSEMIRQQILRTNAQTQQVNGAKDATGDLLVNAGLVDLGNAVKALPQLSPEQISNAVVASDPLTYLQFGAGKAVAEAATGLAGIRTTAFEEADAAAQAASTRATNLATHRAGFQSLLDDPRASAADRQVATSALARLAPQEADAANAVAATSATRNAALADVNQQMANAAKPSFVRNAAGQVMQAAGSGVKMIGDAAEWVENLAGNVLDKVAPDLDPTTKQFLLKRITPMIVGGHTGGFLGGAAGLFAGPAAQAVGRDLVMAGKQLSLGQQTLPFWKAIAENSSGVTKWVASMLDNQLVYAIPDTARGAAAGAALGGTMGFVQSGGTTQGLASGAGPGAVLGAAGAGLGQIHKFNSPAELHTASIGDRAQFIKSLNPASRTMFGQLTPPEQLAISVYARVHPDLSINFVNDKNAPNGNHQVVGDRAQATSNVAGDNALQSILQHEIGHHVAAHGLTNAVDQYMLGDAGLGKPGIFSKLGPDGQPLINVENGVAKYVPDDAFQAYKGRYNKNLTKGDPTAVPATDHDISQEMFAELHAAALFDPADVQKLVRGFVPSQLVSDAAVSNWLARVGVGADPVTGRSVITDTVAKTQGLNDLITEFYRNKNRKSLSPEDPTGAARVPVTAAVKGTEEFDRLSKTFDASGDLKRNPDGTLWTDLAGRPQVLSQKEVDAAHGKLTDQAIDALRRSPQDIPGHEDVVSLRTHRDGKVFYEGQWMPQEAFDALTAVPNQHNYLQIKNWQDLNNIMDRNDGTMVHMVYNTAGNKGAYATLPARSRVVVPIQHQISPSTRQVNILSFDPEQLVTNITKYLRTKKGKDLWDGKIDAANDDAKTYLDNLANNRAGETGIGLEKKAALNELFGFPDSGANPTIADLGKRSPSVIKTFRLDRINQLRELPGVTQPMHRETYEQVRAYQQPRGMGETAPIATPQRPPEPEDRTAIPVTYRTTRTGKNVEETIPYGITSAPLVADKQPTGALSENNFGHVDFLTKPEQQKLTALDKNSAVTTYADKLVDEFGKWKDNPDVMEAKSWYRDVGGLLKKAFGRDSQLFAHLLAATSAGQGVVENWKDALVAYHRYQSGAYDDIIRQFKRDPNQKITEDMKPTKANGAKFGFNSDAVLRVLTGTWLDEVQGPKTPNFFRNLFGRGTDATIDMWAARTMRRLGYDGVEGAPEQWRITPPSETGVSDLDFAFSQEAFRQAAKRLDMDPHELQAVMWYAEKHHWASQGWAKGGVQAAKASYVPMLKEYAAHVSARPSFKEVSPEDFITGRNQTTRPGFLSDLNPEDLSQHKLFTNRNGTIGAAVSPEGDIQNVFNNSGVRGAGAHAVIHAINNLGGRTLDAFDGHLPRLYAQFGFQETGRAKFDPAQAPANWDKKMGTPDVVFMKWNGYPKGGEKAALGRAWDKSEKSWIPVTQAR